jgi:hypothetical protein
MTNRAQQIKEPVIRWRVSHVSTVKFRMTVTDKSTFVVVVGLAMAFIVGLVVSGLTILSK